MIVWSGRGFLSVVVLFATLFLSFSIVPKESADYGFIIAAFVTGIFSWYFGKKWNIKNEKIVVDEKTGERLILKNNHTLFWIPMQYWGIIFSVLGIIILFQNSTAFGVISAFLLLILIAVPMFMSSKPADHSIDSFHTKTKKEEPVSNTNSTESTAAIDELALAKIRKERENPNRFMPK